MMAGCKRSGHEGALNAAISIELIENDLTDINGEKNNLEIMMSPNGRFYCNCFTLHWNGPYKIKVRVSEPGRETERLDIEQEERILSY